MTSGVKLMIDSIACILYPVPLILGKRPPDPGLLRTYPCKRHIPFTSVSLILECTGQDFVRRRLSLARFEVRHAIDVVADFTNIAPPVPMMKQLSKKQFPPAFGSEFGIKD